jgi:hypothetical protein
MLVDLPAEVLTRVAGRLSRVVTAPVAALACRRLFCAVHRVDAWPPPRLGPDEWRYGRLAATIDARGVARAVDAQALLRRVGRGCTLQVRNDAELAHWCHVQLPVLDLAYPATTLRGVARDLRVLHVPNVGSLDLGELARLTRIRTLHLGSARLPRMAGHPWNRLTALSLHASDVGVPEPLTRLPSLTHLSLKSCHWVHTVRRWPRNLRVLEVRACGVTPEWVVGLPQLVAITISNSPLMPGVLTALAHLKGLVSLSLPSCWIRDLTPLLAGMADMPRLTHLRLDHNPFGIRSGLAGLVECLRGRLVGLSMDSCGIHDLDPLWGLGGLRSLSIRDNLVGSVRPLAGLAEIARVDLTGNFVCPDDVEWLAGRLPGTKIVFDK